MKELSEYGLTILHSDYFESVIKAELEGSATESLKVVEEAKCHCDCGCTKETDEIQTDQQCDDCDNGIHWDEIKKKYVTYEEEG